MVAAILLVISTVALGQFALYYSRAVMAGVASQPVSDRLRMAAGIEATSIGPTDFNAVLSVNEMAPGLHGPCGPLRMVRAYYSVVERVGRLLPALAAWSEREMTMCSRYVAVLVDQRLEQNVACAAEMRGV